MAGQITRNIKLYYGEIPSTSGGTISYTKVNNLQQIPNLGGTKESVEVTTYEDAAHMYVNGLISYGESLDFTLLYDADEFATLSALSGNMAWKVELPEADYTTVGTTITFTGEPSIMINGDGINAAFTCTLSVKPTSEMTFA